MKSAPILGVACARTASKSEHTEHTMSHNPRTPFDDFNHTGTAGADDFPTNTTQPLPPQHQPPPGQQTVPLRQGLQTGQPTGNYLNAPPTSPAAAPPAQPVPPAQAVPPVQTQFPARRPAPAPAAPTTSSLGAGTSPLKLPLPTLIGGAVALGAVVAVSIPLLIGRLLPKAPIKELPPSVAAAPPSSGAPLAAPRPQAGEPVEMPPASGSEAAPADAPSVKAPSAKAPSAASEPPDEGPASREDRSAQSGSLPSAPSPDAREAPAAIEDEDKRDEREEKRQDRRNEREAEESKDKEKSEREEKRSEEGGSSARHTGSRYEITPPAGWRKSRSGRRATWQGPGEAQILVEVASGVSSSARADWEKLDRGFRKKYGRRYRSLGIRDTTMGGLPAAAWEFELDSKSGRTTRKIDIAVHDRGRGYAVLGSAPAERFEEVRPQIEEAIASFRLRPSGGSGEGTDGGTARSEDEEEGF